MIRNEGWRTQQNRGFGRRSPRDVVLALGFLGIVPLGTARALPPETDAWIRISSANFVCLSNAGEAPTRDIARNLESLRAVLARLTKGLRLGGGRPTLVYVFRDTDSFAPYKGATAADPRKTMAGFFVRGPDLDLIALDRSAVSYGVIYHEYLHDVLEHSFERLPLWFEEGIADFYTTFECDKTEARIGRPVRDHLDWLGHNPAMPLKDLLTVTHDSKEYNEDSRRGAFYATSWLLVHYLMMGNEARKPQLVRFLEAVEKVPPEEAFVSSFQIDYEGMEKELQTYAKGDSFPYTKWGLSDLRVPDVTSSRPMTRAEILAQLGTLLARIDDLDSTQAEAHLGAALTLEPGQPSALAGLAVLAIRRKHFEEAAQLYAKALERAPDDAGLLSLEGRTLVEQVMGGNLGALVVVNEPSAALLRAREMLTRSLKIEPDDPETLVATGLTWIGDKGDVSPGIAALESAVQRLPRRVDVALSLLTLYVQKLDRKKAEDLVDHRVAIVGSPDEIKRARELLLEIDLREARAMIDKQQFETALPILGKVQGSTTIPDRKAWLDGIIPQVEAAAEWSRENAIYEEAVGLARKGKLSSAAAKLSALVRWCKDPSVCPSAKTSLADLVRAGVKP